MRPSAAFERKKERGEHVPHLERIASSPSHFVQCLVHLILIPCRARRSPATGSGSLRDRPRPRRRIPFLFRPRKKDGFLCQPLWALGARRHPDGLPVTAPSPPPPDMGQVESSVATSPLCTCALLCSPACSLAHPRLTPCRARSNRSRCTRALQRLVPILVPEVRP
jgi:hypothetical protein